MAASPVATPFVATIAGTELEVSIASATPPRWSVQVADRELELDAVVLPSGAVSVIVENRSMIVDVAWGADGRVTVYLDGAVVKFELEDARARRFASMVSHASGGAKKGETLRAPIAGKVVKLAVEVGDDVASGDSVVVLEAMKMENELRAARGGTVKSISVEPGDSVETGQALVTLE